MADVGLKAVGALHTESKIQNRQSKICVVAAAK
jgi:hypothetical protein